jgi:hypothetical protein
VIFKISGLLIGIILGKADCNSGLNPLFKFDLIATIFFNPSSVKCSLFLIKSKAFFQSSKSARFFVIKVYSLKYLIITSISLNEFTI